MTNNMSMKIKRTYTIISISAVIVCGALFSTGCEESALLPVQEDVEPVFYPSPPEQPRIQFLKSYSGPEQVLGKRKLSGFEAFVIGEEEKRDAVGTPIKKPYGAALYDKKLYVCDLDAKTVMVLDLVTGEFAAMSRDRRIVKPASIAIDNGTKYVADSGAGAVLVFDENNEIKGIWGRENRIMPLDIVIKGDNCYVLDANSSQVLVLDKNTGEEINRIGTKGEEEGQLQYVTCLAADDEENVYISDKIHGYITKLNSDGIFQQQFGALGDAPAYFLRVKGIDVDKEGRVWAVDSGSGQIKVYDPAGRLLIAFSHTSPEPGGTYLPAIIRIDYDNIDFFQQFAVEGAKLELLIMVTNQYERNKVNVYGLGSFPAISEEATE